MNWLDIVIVLLLLIAAWQGWRQGVITQVLGLAALVLGIFLAGRYGGAIGGWLGLEQTAARIVGFAIVLVAVILVVVVIGRVTRGVFRIVGLGVFDNFLGVLFSALKMALVAGLLMMLFEVCDPEGRVIPQGVRDGSVILPTIDTVCDLVFPFVRDMFERL